MNASPRTTSAETGASGGAPARQACAAFIASQKHEGWTELSDRFDDGGFSGGNMERPGLTKLLRDIREKRVDVIVVYKSLPPRRRSLTA